MKTETTAGFKLVAGGRPAPPADPPEPDPNAPITLVSGTFYPSSARFDVSLRNGLGEVAPIYGAEALAREVDALLQLRRLDDAVKTDLSEVRRRLAESSLRLALAGSRAYAGHFALYEAHRSSEEGGAIWREIASFDPRLAGLAATLAESRLPSTPPGPTDGYRFALWSVPKERRRCGLYLRAGNKEQTIIAAPGLPLEIAMDWQILVLGSPNRRASAAA